MSVSQKNFSLVPEGPNGPWKRRGLRFIQVHLCNGQDSSPVTKHASPPAPSALPLGAEYEPSGPYPKSEDVLFCVLFPCRGSSVKYKQQVKLGIDKW